MSVCKYVTLKKKEKKKTVIPQLIHFTDKLMKYKIFEIKKFKIFVLFFCLKLIFDNFLKYPKYTFYRYTY